MKVVSRRHVKRTPISDWYVLCCGSKNRNPKDMCSEEFGLHAQNTRTILDSILNTIGGIYMTISCAKESSLGE
jgi:hypothetical protein